MGGLCKNTPLMFVLLQAAFLVIRFSHYMLMIFLIILFVILLFVLVILLSTLSVI